MVCFLPPFLENIVLVVCWNILVVATGFDPSFLRETRPVFGGAPCARRRRFSQFTTLKLFYLEFENLNHSSKACFLCLFCFFFYVYIPNVCNIKLFFCVPLGVVHRRRNWLQDLDAAMQVVLSLRDEAGGTKLVSHATMNCHVSPCEIQFVAKTYHKNTTVFECQ